MFLHSPIVNQYNNFSFPIDWLGAATWIRIKFPRKDPVGSRLIPLQDTQDALRTSLHPLHPLYSELQHVADGNRTSLHHVTLHNMKAGTWKFRDLRLRHPMRCQVCKHPLWTPTTRSWICVRAMTTSEQWPLYHNAGTLALVSSARGWDWTFCKHYFLLQFNLIIFILAQLERPSF